MTRAHAEKMPTSKASKASKARDFTVALAFEIRMRLMEVGNPHGFYARVGFRPISQDAIEIELSIPFVGGGTVEVDLRRATASFGNSPRPAAIVLSGQLVSSLMERVTKNASRESSPWPACAEA